MTDLMIVTELLFRHRFNNKFDNLELNSGTIALKGNQLPTLKNLNNLCGLEAFKGVDM